MNIGAVQVSTEGIKKKSRLGTTAHFLFVLWHTWKEEPLMNGYDYYFDFFWDAFPTDTFSLIKQTEISNGVQVVHV